MTDRQIEERVVWELDVDPQVRADHILVDVEEGLVILSGYVDNEEQRRTAERATRRVYGVRAVADELALKRSRDGELADTDLAREAVWALEVHNTELPIDRIQVTVCEGWVTLEGEVEWRHQKEAAEATIAHVAGVRGITNRIAVRSPAASILQDVRSGEASRARALLCGLLPEAIEEVWPVLQGSLDCWPEDEADALTAT